MGVPFSYWNEAYRDGTYLKNWDYQYASQELIGLLLLLNLNEQSTLLDLGCGAGRDAIYLSQLGYNVHGVDFSEEAIRIAIERAKEMKTKTHFQVANVLSLPFPNESFELISDRACFHHIAHEDRSQYANEVSRTLKSGGYLLLRGSFREEKDSFYAVTEETIKKYFSKEDLTIVKILPIVLANNAGQLGGNITLIRKR